mmetsp:Transcript_12617/g.42654  ORF Transcript_12617/g.42654 Transcript_12617/m.42654 type:complete len:278 (+) Transcript_12617:217-1050(+)
MESAEAHRQRELEQQQLVEHEAGGGRVCFCGNVSWSTTDEELRDFMAACGDVLSAVVQRHEDTGRSKGWALVEFASSAEAAAAVAQLDGQELNERRVHVRLDRSHLASGGQGTACAYVGNCPWSTTDLELAELFSPYEPIACSIMKNMSGRSRGFGIIRFRNEEFLAAAIRDMNGFQLHGRQLEVRQDRGPGRAAVTEKRSLFVGGLAPSVTDVVLRNLFSACGKVMSSRVQRRSGGESKGWGLVEFSTADEAALAIATLGGTELEGQVLEVRHDSK